MTAKLKTFEEMWKNDRYVALWDGKKIRNIEKNLEKFNSTFFIE